MSLEGSSRVLVVDGRDPRQYPLTDLLQRLRERHDAVVLGTGPETLQRITREPPAVILLHAGLGLRPDLPAEGPLIAAMCARQQPSVPILLYTGNPAAGREEVLAQLAVAAPVVFDQRLLRDLASLIAALCEHGAAVSSLQGRESITGASGHDESLPAGFRVDRFLDEVDLAVMRAAIREHPDRTDAAAAIGLPVETLAMRLRQHSLEVPRGARPDSMRGETLLWCSSVSPPDTVAAAADSAGVGLREVEPGSLHPSSVHSMATLAAISDVTDPSGAVDAWVLQRTTRPRLVVRASAPAPVRLLLEQLGVRASDDPPWAVPTEQLLRAGRCAVALYRDEQPRRRLQYRPDGRRAWPLELGQLRSRLDRRILTFARGVAGSSLRAAEAVGLEERTFRRRLRASTGP